MLLLVEDANDNAPVFARDQLTVHVAEHQTDRTLVELFATDRDSGIYGQVPNY